MLILLVLITVTTIASARLYIVAGLGQVHLDVERDFTCFNQCRAASAECRAEPDADVGMCLTGYADCLEICITN